MIKQQSIWDNYSTKFEQLVRGLCNKFEQQMCDSMWAYEDLLQEAEIEIFEREIHEVKKLTDMGQESTEKYLYKIIKDLFIDISRRSENRKKAEDKYFG